MNITYLQDYVANKNREFLEQRVRRIGWYILVDTVQPPYYGPGHGVWARDRVREVLGWENIEATIEEMLKEFNPVKQQEILRKAGLV